jgi:hypothetical protein
MPRAHGTPNVFRMGRNTGDYQREREGMTGADADSHEGPVIEPVEITATGTRVPALAMHGVRHRFFRE